MAPSSRIQQARRRVRTARYVIASIAAAGFGGAIAAAAATHPATHSSSGASAQATSQATATDDFTFGGGSYIAPSTSAPSLQSSGS